MGIPKLSELTEHTFRNRPMHLCKRFVTLPAYFVTGTILVTWTVYMFAFLFRNKKEPLIYANGITLSMFLVFSVVGIYVLWKRNSIDDANKIEIKRKTMKMSDWVFLGLVAFLSIQLMWMTFFVAHNHLYVGYSVFSDAICTSRKDVRKARSRIS